MIIYRINDGKLQLLMIESSRGIEDIGGRTAVGDTCIDDTISREVSEETNNIITAEMARHLLQNTFVIDHYHTNGKYQIKIVNATDEIIKLESYQFGDMEIHDKIERNIKWITYPINRLKLHHRLRDHILDAKLHALQPKNNKLDQPSAIQTKNQIQSTSDNHLLPKKFSFLCPDDFVENEKFQIAPDNVITDSYITS